MSAINRIADRVIKVAINLRDTPNSRIATSIHYIPSWTRQAQTIHLNKLPNGTNSSIDIPIELCNHETTISKLPKSIICSLVDNNNTIIERKILRVFSMVTSIAKSSTGEYRTVETLRKHKKRHRYACERIVPDPLEFTTDVE
jgi:hypothetical protein